MLAMAVLGIWRYKTTPVLLSRMNLFFAISLFQYLRSRLKSYNMRVKMISVAFGFYAVGALAKEKAVDMSRHGKTSAVHAS